MAEEPTKETSKEETQYADFSDMQGTEIPDEVEFPQPDVSVQYIEDSPEETQEETAEAEAPQETSEVNRKGEPLSPDQERYWQHKFDTEAKPLREQNELLKQEIETIKTQLNPPKEAEKLVEPIKPATDDPNDMLDYLNAKDAYNSKLLAQKFDSQEKYFQQIEQERQQRAQAEEANQLKSYQLGKLQTVGRLTPEEAVDAITMFSNPAQSEDEYYGYIADFYKHRRGISASPRTTNVKKTPAPLATQAGEAKGQKVEDGDQFFGDMNNYIKENY